MATITIPRMARPPREDRMDIDDVPPVLVAKGGGECGAAAGLLATNPAVPRKRPDRRPEPTGSGEARPIRGWRGWSVAWPRVHPSIHQRGLIGRWGFARPEGPSPTAAWESQSGLRSGVAHSRAHPVPGTGPPVSGVTKVGGRPTGASPSTTIGPRPAPSSSF